MNRKFTKSKKGIMALAFALFAMGGQAQKLPGYRNAENIPNANYYTIVKAWRAHFEEEKKELKAAGAGGEETEEFREEVAQFERWAYNWRDKVDAQGHFPNAAQGWGNLLKTNARIFNSTTGTTNRTAASTWTSLGPLDSAISNGWTYGGGIGRVNCIRKQPGKSRILFAGTAAGGIFKSDNMGDTWTPVTDNMAGLGISDIVFDPTNSDVIYASTGDWDTDHMSSIGVYKSTDGGNTWEATGLAFSLNQSYRIAHLAIDPANVQILYATGKDAIHRSADGGATWTEVYKPGQNNFFNDIIKIKDHWYVSDRTGKLYKSSNEQGTSFDVFKDFNRNEERLDFAWTPADSSTLYLLFEKNPAFGKINIDTKAIVGPSNVTNANTADGNANFKTQQGYNQVIAVSPTNKDSIWVGEFSGGKLSVDGGATWTNKFNGYYDPNSSSTNWGGFYLHSDQHDFQFVGSDTMLVANDGGVYIGRISTNEFKQKFNGLVITQSYSIAIDDADPSNLIVGNQDNDGMSSITENGVAKFYGAQAGDGTVTAISHNNNLVRYIGSTNGGLGYREDGFKAGFATNSITNPTEGPFIWDMQMHSTNGSILYGGLTGLYKMMGAPTNTWSLINTGLTGKVQSITLAHRDANTQKIIIIGEDKSIHKSGDEVNWSTITPPAGVSFNSIYAMKNNWDTLYATATGYDAANKIFMSTDNGATWNNITKNFPNIVAKKIVAYEGTDTVFVATELGIYYASVKNATTTGSGANTWSRFGVGLPNVRVEDMEISYTKKQLYIGSFGRGIWMVGLAPTNVLALQALQFSYVKVGTTNLLKWNIGESDLVKTVLERSEDGSNFKTVAEFTAVGMAVQPGYAVSDRSTVYYRLVYTKASGKTIYSNVIIIRADGHNSFVSVYPNPTQGQLSVSSENIMQSVKLFTIGGQQVSFAKPQTNLYSFDMSILPKGIYLLEVIDINGDRFQQRIVRN